MGIEAIAKQRTEGALGSGGQMGERIRGFDWSTTSLGTPEHWPVLAGGILDDLLTSDKPMFIGLGPDLNFLYNDAFIPVIEDKHPDVLGLPLAQVWVQGDRSLKEPLTQVLPEKEATTALLDSLLGSGVEPLLSMSLKVVRDDSGNVWCLIGLCKASVT